jgi:hypothetical protein
MVAPSYYIVHTIYQIEVQAGKQYAFSTLWSCSGFAEQETRFLLKTGFLFLATFEVDYKRAGAHTW